MGVNSVFAILHIIQFVIFNCNRNVRPFMNLNHYPSYFYWCIPKSFTDIRGSLRTHPVGLKGPRSTLGARSQTREEPGLGTSETWTVGRTEAEHSRCKCVDCNMCGNLGHFILYTKSRRLLIIWGLLLSVLCINSSQWT
jgi:hypothetical protein